MTVQEFIKDLGKNLNIDSQDEDFQMLISASALKEIEMPESFANKHKETFLTKDAAINSKELYEHHKKNVYNSLGKVFDEHFEGLDLGDDFINDIKSEYSIPNRIKKSLAKAKELASNSKTYSKDINEALKQQAEKHKEELQKIAQENEQIKNSWNSDIDKFKNLRKKDAFMNKVLKYDIPDTYPVDDLANAFWTGINEKYHIAQNDEGGFIVKNKENPDLDVYENNTKVEFEDILNQKLEPFIRKQPPKQEPQKPVNGNFKQATPGSILEQKQGWWLKQAQ